MEKGKFKTSTSKFRYVSYLSLNVDVLKHVFFPSEDHILLLTLIGLFETVLLVKNYNILLINIDDILMLVFAK